MEIIRQQIKKTLGTLGYRISKVSTSADLNWLLLLEHENAPVSFDDFLTALGKIPSFKDKIVFSSFFDIRDVGVRLKANTDPADFRRIVSQYAISGSTDPYSKEMLKEINTDEFEKVHYGCGNNIFEGWMNVDFPQRSIENYANFNLAQWHPLKNETFKFGFAEDFLEHLTQEDSLIFLSQAFRTLKKGGVLRLSFPALEGVLKKHYPDNSFPTYYLGKIEAYLVYDHFHFYSREELTLVAKHIGYSRVDFVEFGKSEHSELRNLDTREHQKELNTYAELTK